MRVIYTEFFRPLMTVFSNQPNLLLVSIVSCSTACAPSAGAIHRGYYSPIADSCASTVNTVLRLWVSLVGHSMFCTPTAGITPIEQCSDTGTFWSELGTSLLRPLMSGHQDCFGPITSSLYTRFLYHISELILLQLSRRRLTHQTWKNP
jgi:hypothetical protein